MCNLCREQLDSHRTPQFQIFSFIDFTHPTLPELLQDSKMTYNFFSLQWIQTRHLDLPVGGTESSLNGVAPRSEHKTLYDGEAQSQGFCYLQNQTLHNAQLGYYTTRRAVPPDLRSLDELEVSSFRLSLDLRILALKSIPG